MSAAVTVQGNEDRTHIALSDVAQDSVQLRGIVRGLVVLCHPLPDGAHATPTPRPRLRHAPRGYGARALTEQLCPIPSRHAHQLVLPTRVEAEVRCDVVHDTVECAPRVVAGFVLMSAMPMTSITLTA